MDRPLGHTARSKHLLALVSLRRIWLGLLLLAIAAILAWKSDPDPDQKDRTFPDPPPHPSAPQRENTSHRPPSTSDHAKPLSANSFTPGLPGEIEQYLDAFDNDLAEELHPAASDRVGPREVVALVLRFNFSNETDSSDRILALLSDLKESESLAAAKRIVLEESRELDDPALLACATSLAKNGNENDIQAILERLNQLTLDDSGEIPEDASPFIRSLSMVSARELEWFIGQAAEGKWTATSEAARLAAVHALHSYPTANTTAILARLRDHEQSLLIRNTASEILTLIQSQHPE